MAVEVLRELPPLEPDRVKAIEDELTMLVAICELSKNKRRESGKRVDISYVLLMELPEQADRVQAAIEVSEALGHPVEVEVDRGEKGGIATPLAIGLQFFTYVVEPKSASE